MNTLRYAKTWQYMIFRGLIRTGRKWLDSLITFALLILDKLSQCRNPIVAGTARIVEQSAKTIGVKFIRGYQKYLSPYKGFSCAHRILYGGSSCSQYVRQMLLEQDLRSAIALSRQRFAACKTAKIVLRSQELEKKEEQKKKTKPSKSNKLSEGCIDPADCGCAFLEESIGSVDCGDSFSNCGDMGDCGSNLDCTPDCGNLDCSSCDCG